MAAGIRKVTEVKPLPEIEACQRVHRRLLQAVELLTDDEVLAPSLLSGWNRAHVMTHLARNADSHVFLLEGVQIGERRRQYASPDARDTDILAGGTRRAAELRADLDRACVELEQAWASLPGPLWRDEVVVTPGGRPASELVFRRLREVEVHLVDLDVGCSPSEWSD